MVLALRLSRWLAVVPLLVSFGAAFGQSWPSKPVRFIVPFPPGGVNDLMPRIFAEYLQPALGQPFVVENRPGGGSSVGTAYAATQAPDGYNLLVASLAHVVNVSFFARLPYDPIKDFAPIALTASIPFVLTVNPSIGVSTTKDFIGYLKTHPGSTYASAGIGTSQHLSAELLKTMTGVEITHIPYKGAQQIVPALLSGDVTFTIHSMSSLVQHFKSGKLRALAVAASSRSPLAPDVPTMAESGPLPGYGIDLWFGVLAPAGTPRPIIDRLNAELLKIVRDPKVVQDKYAPVGMSPMSSSPEEFADLMRKDLVKYQGIAKAAGIKPE